MFFRLPVVRFFNRVINRATVTVALVLLQIGWLLWAFFSLTAGKVWEIRILLSQFFKLF